jgi:hypothetical protein
MTTAWPFGLSVFSGLGGFSRLWWLEPLAPQEAQKSNKANKRLVFMVLNFHCAVLKVNVK